MKSPFFPVLAGFGTLVLAILIFLFAGLATIEGDERAVIQTWSGVQDALWSDGTHPYVPLWTTPHVYKIGAEKFIMGQAELYNGKGSDTVDYPAFTVTTGGSGKEQPATFSVTLNYRLDPDKLVALHRKAKGRYEDLVIKPNLTRIISDMATTKTVLEFYSGEGRVALQNDIKKAIEVHPALAEVGIIVDEFVIDAINLDPNYVAEITGRQLATQKKLRAIEEARAAEEVAKKVEAEAEADKLRRIVAAEATKEEKIRAAQAQAEEVKLAADANAHQIKAKAEAERFRKEQDAKGLLAQGMAEAQVAKEKKVSKYEGQAGARQAAVEIEQAKTERMKNMKITGVIPEGAAMTFIDGKSLNETVMSLPVSQANTK